MKRSIKFALLFTTLLLSTLTTNVLATDTMDTPEEVVNRALNALMEKNLDVYASYVHPQAKERLKAILWPMMEVAAANDSIASMTSLPRMLGLKVVDGKPEQIDASVFFLNLMNALKQVSPGATSAPEGTKHVILGTVPEGDSLLYCVIRMENDLNDKMISRVQLVTLRQSSDGWKLELSAELETAATRLGQLMKRASAAMDTPESK